MSDQRSGGIAWTEHTWNPVRGCSRVSEGCRNCYAEQVARRFSGPGQPYEGLVTIGAKGARWSGTTKFVQEHLADPLRWGRPRMVFVNSMSDLFHESIAFDDIAAIFGVMGASWKHAFQVLTKRPERAREFFAWLEEKSKTYTRNGHAEECYRHARRRIDAPESDRSPRAPLWHPALPSFPFPNVWIGVSVEDQETADQRIPVLLELPAAIRWVSYEPALGPVNFDLLSCEDGESYQSSFRLSDDEDGIDWIVVGGESGREAREFHLSWARDTIRQARESSCAVFVKQLGAVAYETRNMPGGMSRLLDLDHPKGGSIDEWPKDLRVREYPKVRT